MMRTTATTYLLAWLAVTARADSTTPSELAKDAAEVIRHEVLMPANGPEGRPLPLVSHWNMGSHGRGWMPDYQVELLNQGHFILPWMGWPQGDPARDEKSRKRFEDYYGNLVARCRDLKLPISFRGTQWESLLVKKVYRDRPPDQCPAVITPDGQSVSRLSPFGPIDPWKEPAGVYVDTPAMKRIQEMYPKPPLVLFVSNNEAPRLRWAKEEGVSQSGRYLARYGRGRSDSFKRKVVGRGWAERYPVMFQAMRDALVSECWKRNVRFVGYGAFGPSHFGRWDGWKVYSLICDEWIDPEPFFWNGSSPSYYTHNWCDNRDHWVWSPQVQSMNWIFMLEDVFKKSPDFWWEISTWDGNSTWHPGMEFDKDLLKKSKACQYMKEGQSYTPDRHEGWLCFGLWLLRPRVLREFHNSTAPLDPWQPFFERTLRIVDRVHTDPVLKEFWRHGELAPNRTHKHPYQVDIPEKYKDVDRWYLLDTSLDAPRPWSQKTDIPVFGLALVQGNKGTRRWLLFAHSPLGDRGSVSITIPEYGPVTVDVPRAGAFWIVEEKTGRIRTVES